MNDKYIYVVFSRTGTTFSNVIAFFTKKEYSHVSISLDDSFESMYSFGRIIPELPLPAGFVRENLYDGVFAMFPESTCLIYKVKVSITQFNKIKYDLNKFYDNKEYLKYNLLGTASALFNKPYERENYYFCSQFVSEILINSGVYETDKHPALIKPMDLLDIKNKSFIYQGVIRESKIINPASRQASYDNIASDSYPILWYMFGKVKKMLSIF